MAKFLGLGEVKVMMNLYRSSFERIQAFLAVHMQLPRHIADEMNVDVSNYLIQFLPSEEFKEIQTCHSSPLQICN